MKAVQLRPLPADLKLLRMCFRVLPRGYGPARRLWARRLERLGAVAVPTRLGFTLLVKLVDVIGFAQAMHPCYEGPLGAILAHHLRAGDVFADVGANYGWYTLYAAKLLGASRGRVFAFEPQAELAELIRRAAELNRLDNVTVLEAAAADHPSRGVLQTDWEGNSGFVWAVATDGMNDPVQVVTLDQELGDATPSVVKIDVEGGEWRVLRGMRSLLARSALSTLIVEVHPEKMARLGDNAVRLSSLLREQGFRLYRTSMQRQKGPLPELNELTGDLPDSPCWNLLARR